MPKPALWENSGSTILHLADVGGYGIKKKPNGFKYVISRVILIKRIYD